MKRVIVYTCTGFAVLLLGTVSCKQKDTTQRIDNKETYMVLDSSKVRNMPVLKFVKNRYDFGTAKKKDTPIAVIFEFQNTGDVPLVIQKVDVSCGCLSADYPKEPILPNEKGTISVQVNVNDFTGAFNKTLFVKSNTIEDVILLRILGQVK